MNARVYLIFRLLPHYTQWMSQDAEAVWYYNILLNNHKSAKPKAFSTLKDLASKPSVKKIL